MSEHFPRPWKIDPHALSIYSSETPKGCARVADLRGWGYLTGKGYGALGLSDDDGIAAQRANAELIVKAVNSHDALVAAMESIAGWRKVNISGEYEHSLRDIIRSITDCAAAALDAIPSPVGGAAK